MKAWTKEISLQFKTPAGTSRGVLLNKPSVLLFLEENGMVGVGECSLIPGLSVDPLDGYAAKLREICDVINGGGIVASVDLSLYPSIAFGLEVALLDLKSSGSKILFHNSFTSGRQGILINGLIWMGNKEFMLQQIKDKLEVGYQCLKLKVGALDFDSELEILRFIRQQFSAKDIEIRLDANGGFSKDDALVKLDALSKFSIHSIEQPIMQGQWESLARICSESPIPVVLDEELIGLSGTKREEMLDVIRPAFVILKPSLIGGLASSQEWLRLLELFQTQWWITSALEGNVGLNAIAQWTSTLNTSMPQGLGTGSLYENNIPSPLEIRNASLFYNPSSCWDLSVL